MTNENQIDKDSFGDFEEGDAYCPGDTPIDEIDWDRVHKLQDLQTEVLGVSEEERPMKALGLLHEMYGDNLEVL